MFFSNRLYGLTAPNIYLRRQNVKSSFRGGADLCVEAVEEAAHEAEPSRALGSSRYGEHSRREFAQFDEVLAVGGVLSRIGGRIESLFFGLKVNLGQARNISGAFRQAWYRPLMGIVINLGVSILLCYKIGICGVIIGTITADVLTNFLIDPFIIHKYSYKGFKPASYYYKKNLIYMLILAVVGVADYLLCRVLVTGLPIVDLVIHALICLLSVPVTFMIIYQKTDVCQYLFERVRSSKWIQRHKRTKS